MSAQNRPTAAEVAGQLPLGAAPDLVVRWTNFNDELLTPSDAKKAEEDWETSTMFPRVQPHLRCGKRWLGTLCPPLPLCATGIHWRLAARAANDPKEWLGSVEW